MKSKIVLAAAFAVLILATAAAVILCIFPVQTGDETLNALLYDVLSRLCLSAGLCAVIIAADKRLLAFPRITKGALLFFLPCLLVPFANFPFSALVTGNAVVERPDLLWLFLIKCALIAIIEELVFRGILTEFAEKLCERKSHKIIIVILSTSAAFALFHLFNLLDGSPLSAVALQVGYSFLLGCMLSAVYLKTRNIWGCIALHALFDVGGLIVTDLGHGSVVDTVFIILTVVCGLIVAAHVLCGIFMGRKK